MYCSSLLALRPAPGASTTIHAKFLRDAGLERMHLGFRLRQTGVVALHGLKTKPRTRKPVGANASPFMETHEIKRVVKISHIYIHHLLEFSSDGKPPKRPFDRVFTFLLPARPISDPHSATSVAIRLVTEPNASPLVGADNTWKKYNNSRSIIDHSSRLSVNGAAE